MVKILGYLFITFMAFLLFTGNFEAFGWTMLGIVVGTIIEEETCTK